MGAGSNHKDVFVEIGAMRAEPGRPTGRGGTGEIRRAQPSSDAGGLEIDRRRFQECAGREYRWRQRDQVAHRCRPRLSQHRSGAIRGLRPTNTSSDCTREFTDLARGGESIKEVACVEDTQTPARWACQFPAYPGTVMWKIGFQRYKEAFVHDDGTELVSVEELARVPGGR